MVRSPYPGGGELVQHRATSGDLLLPVALDGIVTAVLGLDDRPQVRRYVQAAEPGFSVKLPQLAKWYDPKTPVVLGRPPRYWSSVAVLNPTT